MTLSTLSLKPFPRHNGTSNEPEKLKHFEEYRPVGELSKYVKSIFYFDFSQEYNEITKLKDSVYNSKVTERLIPSGCSDLIIQSTHGFSMSVPELKQEVILPKSFFTPVITVPVRLEQLASVRIFGVRLLPWATKSFFKKNNQYSGLNITDAEYLFTTSTGHELNLKLFNTDLQNGFLLLEEWLIEFLKKNGAIDEIVSDAIALMLKKKGVVELDKLLNQYGLTKRRIEQRFNECVGMCPKQYSRMIKFQSIFQAINTGKIKLLTDIVYECGYHDQSHLIRNFREFTGTTPKKYFSEQNLISNFFTSKNSPSFILNT